MPRSNDCKVVGWLLGMQLDSEWSGQHGRVCSSSCHFSILHPPSDRAGITYILICEEQPWTFTTTQLSLNQPSTIKVSLYDEWPFAPELSLKCGRGTLS